MNKKRVNNKTIVILIVSMAFLFIGSYMVYVYSLVNKYATLFYPKVKIEEIDLGGKNKEEGLKLVEERYREKILKKSVKIQTYKKDYYIKYAELEVKYDIKKAVDEAFSYGKRKNLFDKFQAIKKPVERKIAINFEYNEKALEPIILEIERETKKEPVNAAISKDSSGKFNIKSEVLGKKLNIDKLKKDIFYKFKNENNDDIIIEAKSEDIKPKITKEILSKINTKVAGFSTDYSNSSSERANNVAIATKSINGIFLMPEEIFSFNKVVGKRTKEKGYKDAPIIIENKLEDGIGGGVCQVSTTLYNAVLRANMASVEREHHTIPSSYVGIGMDATVDYGNADYKFKNTLSYPVYIESYTNNGKITINVYSDSSLAKRKYDIVNDVYEKIPNSVKYVEDTTVPKGIEVIDIPGTNGYRVKVYKVTYENGKKISKDLLYNDYYAPVNKLIKRGVM